MPAPLTDDEEPYASSEDSDFAPETGAAADESEQSASEDEGPEDSSKRQKQQQHAANTNASKRSSATTSGNGIAAVADVGYDNSGDEAIIKKGVKKRKKGKGNDRLEDDEGGEGGLIKTRRQRAAEKEERKVAASKGPVTINVDDVWAQMLSGQTDLSTQQAPESDDMVIDTEDTGTTVQANHATAVNTASDPSNLVRIKRTYNFAGQVHTEEKLVSLDSAEAKLFIASGGQIESVSAGDATSPTNQPSKRIARKAFRSSFEPIIDATQPRRSDLDLGVAARMKASRDAQAKKLNTVEKSRMDWAGFVDKEGIQDELELAGKSKDSYAARQDFLQRSELRREDDARRARLTGKV